MRIGQFGSTTYIVSQICVPGTTLSVSLKLNPPLIVSSMTSKARSQPGIYDNSKVGTLTFSFQSLVFCEDIEHERMITGALLLVVYKL